jgi:hyperosmotically inducible protein
MGRLIRSLLTLLIIVLVVAYFLGYLPNTAAILSSGPRIDASKIPATAAEAKDQAARAAARMDDTLADAALTTKIKAKLALDDTLKGVADVNVHTKDSVVTISGTVATPAAKARVLQLARETSGVKSITDQIVATGGEKVDKSEKLEK